MERRPRAVWEGAVVWVPWLDGATAGYVRRVVASVARQRPEAVAAILFGSVARREARPLSDPSPSEVSVLLLFAPAPAGRGDGGQHQVVSEALVVEAFAVAPHSPRDVQLVEVASVGVNVGVRLAW